MEKKKSAYQNLSAIDVSGKTEKKGDLTYLSWAWAWAVAKDNYPTLSRTVYEDMDGLNYHNDGKTAWVKVGVTIDEIEHIDYLPVMTTMGRPKSIPLEAVTSFEVNTAIQRSTTKALALHGLGLNIYSGEDLPISEIKITTNGLTPHKPQQFVLDIGDDNWHKVVKYVSDNKKLGLTKIVKNLSMKYKVSTKAKKEIDKILKS